MRRHGRASCACLSRQVEYAGHRYVAAVIAPLGPLRAQHAEMVRAMSLGVAIALLVAAVGGWVIGRQTLKPLAAMADQAGRSTNSDPEGEAGWRRRWTTSSAASPHRSTGCSIASPPP